MVLKQFCRRAVARAVYRTPLLGVIRRLAGDYTLKAVPGYRVPRLRRDTTSKFGILCYHRVGHSGVPLFSRLDPKVFSAQMRYLKRRYRLVPLDQLCLEIREGRAVEPTLAITFDDGYQDLYRFALPVLQNYGVPATIYLIGHCVETGEAPWYDRIFVALQGAKDPVVEMELGTPRRFTLTSVKARVAAAWEIVCYLRTLPDEQRRVWCARLEQRLSVPPAEVSDCMLNWRHVREMHRAGVHFGAHTMTHPAVSRLAHSAFPEELLQSKKLLEDGLDAAVEDFAYPFGKPSDLSCAAGKFLRSSGYRSAVTTVSGHNKIGADLFSLRRMQIGDDRSIANFAFDVGRMFLEDPAEAEWNSPSASEIATSSGPQLNATKRNAGPVHA